MRFLRTHRDLLILAFFLLCVSCNSSNPETDTASIPAIEMDEHIQPSISGMLAAAAKTNGNIDDVTELHAWQLLQHYYAKQDFRPVWSSNKKWNSTQDSLMRYLGVCERDGLFSKAYQFDSLRALVSMINADSTGQQPVAAWAKADLLLTDAFMHIVEDLKHGRLHTDSLSWKYDDKKYESFFDKYLDTVLAGASMSSVFEQLQPAIPEYNELKKAIPSFLDSMHHENYTYLVYPFKDTSSFYKRFKQRLAEDGITQQLPVKPDSLAFAKMVSAYQQAKSIAVTGKLTAALVQRLNNTDFEKLKRIAITLDRYKQLSPPLPADYIWVNLPSYYLQVLSSDSVVMESKVIIGKPHTPTPMIISAISDLVIYPTWTIPNSIIRKEILPGLKKDPGYLQRKGFALFDWKGNLVDPFSVNWAKYEKDIPYLVRQGSGDDNALGVIKFNFKNPFSVYLHDTNQRYLFKNKSRSLSHGCVRVEAWEKLTSFIVKRDSMFSKQPDSMKLSTDSISTWLAQKQRKVVGISNRLPVYIGYYTCVAKNGRIRFYEDVYSKDKAAREKYVAFK